VFHSRAAQTTILAPCSALALMAAAACASDGAGAICRYLAERVKARPAGGLSGLAAAADLACARADFLHRLALREIDVARMFF
jgi:hypothetical protein